MHTEILDKNRIEVFKKISSAIKENFYLAGGTALALQIGHRTSFDFDFYSEQSFNNRVLLQKIYKVFPAKEIKELMEENGTLILSVKGVEVSFFHYSYKLVGKFSDFFDINIVSKEDIAAMKIVAISQRGVKRDYIDLYYLIKEFGLEKIFQFTKRKYPTFNYLIGLKALDYFEEADTEQESNRISVFDSKISWKVVKLFIHEEVKKYQEKLLK